MLDDRLQQWSEYEGTFDRLLTWLCETETSLKDYVPRSSLEQKEEQMEKYQVTTSIPIRLCKYSSRKVSPRQIKLNCTPYIFSDWLPKTIFSNEIDF